MADPADGPLLGIRIANAMYARGMSLYRLQKETGIGLHPLQIILKGEAKQTSVFTVRAIARTLGVSIDELVGTWDCERKPSQGKRRDTEVPR